jgi:hypothetical protein
MPFSVSSARLVVLLTLVALPALAQGRAARLLDAGDAPALAQAEGGGSAVHLVPQGDVAAADAAGPGYGEHFIKTLAVSVFATGGGAVVGALLGPLSNNLIVAAISAVLPNLIIGPLLTALAAVLVGNGGAYEGRYGFWGAFGISAGLNAVVLIVTSFVLNAVPWANPAALLLYSLVDGLLMTGGSVSLMHLTGPKPVSAVLPSFVPGVSDTQVVSVGKVEF